jgi:hypothetical protein
MCRVVISQRLREITRVAGATRHRSILFQGPQRDLRAISTTFLAGHSTRFPSHLSCMGVNFGLKVPKSVREAAGMASRTLL